MTRFLIAALLSLPVAVEAYPQFSPSGMPNTTGIGKTYSTPSSSYGNSSYGGYGSSYSGYSNSTGSYGRSSSYGSSYGSSSRY